MEMYKYVVLKIGYTFHCLFALGFKGFKNMHCARSVSSQEINESCKFHNRSFLKVKLLKVTLRWAIQSIDHSLFPNICIMQKM